MKKNATLALSTLTIMFLASCSEQQDFNQADVINAAVESANAGDVPIRFGTYLGGTTRAINGVAGEITNATLKKDATHEAGFGVFAYYKEAATEEGAKYDGATMPNFMWNQQVRNNSSGDTPDWIYSPVKYWPNGIDAANTANKPSNTATQDKYRMLSFFAYAPYVETAGDDYGITSLPSKTATVEPSIGYALPAANPTLATSVDLLWGLRGKTTYDESDNTANYVGSYPDYNADLTKQTTSERVKFDFKHALAQIGGLKVVADIDGNGTGLSGFGSYYDDYTVVTLNSVNIKSTDDASTHKIYKSGSLNISTGAWTGTTAYADDISIGSYTASESTIDATLKEQTPVYSSGWKQTGGSAALLGVPATTAVDVYSSYDPVVFIPVSGNSPNLEVAVEYVVRTYDSGLDATASGGEGTWSKVTQTITNTVTLPEMQQNTKYTLVMHLGLTSVKFSAEVADWDDAAVKEVWLPSNVIAYKTSASVAADADSYSFDFSAYSAALGDNLTATITGSGISGDPTISGTTATIPLTHNTTTSKVENTVTIQGDKGKVVLTLTQNPVAISVTLSSSSVVKGSSISLTVKNVGSDTEIESANYSVSVFTDSGCTTPATSSAFTHTAGTNSVTFNTAGTYYIKVTSGESEIVSSAITITES